jgi:hypothetical protein
LKKRTNQKCKSVVCAFLVVVADDVAPHRLQGGEKEKKQSQANPFSGDSRTAREPLRRQMRWRVGRRAATVLAPRNPAEHCSGLQKVFPVNSRLFWGCYL